MGGYQVLARKWRPVGFSTVVGQNPVCKALKNALDRGRLHHAYLFSGTRGVGKTTIARIFARCLSCEKGVTSSPCGTCSNCVELAHGSFIDLIEIDAASRTRVEETREMLQNVVYAPNKGKFKIYLIDEVHMFSNHSFNALLKTLEEPPDHVKFLLATTNPEALPATIVSRCLHFHLRPLPPDHIKNHLVTIVKEEDIAYDDDALELIARKSEGSVRDALGFLDQSIAYCDGRLQAGHIAAILGMVDFSTMLQLLEAVIDENHEAALKLIKDFAAAGVDFDSTLAEMLHRLHQIALVQLSPKSREDLPESLQSLVLLADRATPEDIQLYYQIALYGRRDAAFAADARDSFEMTILRMLAFAPPDRNARSGDSRPAATAAVAKREEPPPQTESAPVAVETAAAKAKAAGAEKDAADDSTSEQLSRGASDGSAPALPEDQNRPAESPPLESPNQQTKAAPVETAAAKAKSAGAEKDAADDSTSKQLSRGASDDGGSAPAPPEDQNRPAESPPLEGPNQPTEAAPVETAAAKTKSAGAEKDAADDSTSKQLSSGASDDGGSAPAPHEDQNRPAESPPLEGPNQQTEAAPVETTAAKANAAGSEKDAADDSTSEQLSSGASDDSGSAPASPEDWNRLAESLPLKGPNQQLALHSKFVSCRHGVLSLQLSRKNRHLHSDSGLRALSSAVAKTSGRELKVEISLVDNDEASMSTPQNAIDKRKAHENQEHNRRFRETNRDLLDTFDASTETRRRGSD